MFSIRLVVCSLMPGYGILSVFNLRFPFPITITDVKVRRNGKSSLWFVAPNDV